RFRFAPRADGAAEEIERQNLGALQDLRRDVLEFEIGDIAGERFGFMGHGVASLLRCHSGAMRSIEPGISRFRVRSCGPSRNDDKFRKTAASRRQYYFPRVSHSKGHQTASTICRILLRAIRRWKGRMRAR